MKAAADNATGINVERNPETELDAPVAVPEPAVSDVG